MTETDSTTAHGVDDVEILVGVCEWLRQQPDDAARDFYRPRILAIASRVEAALRALPSPAVPGVRPETLERLQSIVDDGPDWQAPMVGIWRWEARTILAALSAPTASAAESASSLNNNRDVRDALHLAHHAIKTAITAEDGLDGADGEVALRAIERCWRAIDYSTPPGPPEVERGPYPDMTDRVRFQVEAALHSQMLGGYVNAAKVADTIIAIVQHGQRAAAEPSPEPPKCNGKCEQYDHVGTLQYCCDECLARKRKPEAGEPSNPITSSDTNSEQSPEGSTDHHEG